MVSHLPKPNKIHLKFTTGLYIRLSFFDQTGILDSLPAKMLASVVINLTTTKTFSVITLRVMIRWSMQNDRTDHALLLLLDLVKNIHFQKSWSKFCSPHVGFKKVPAASRSDRKKTALYKTSTEDIDWTYLFKGAFSQRCINIEGFRSLNVTFLKIISLSIKYVFGFYEKL